MTYKSTKTKSQRELKSSNHVRQDEHLRTQVRMVLYGAYTKLLGEPVAYVLVHSFLSRKREVGRHLFNRFRVLLAEFRKNVVGLLIHLHSVSSDHLTNSQRNTIIGFLLPFQYSCRQSLCSPRCHDAFCALIKFGSKINSRVVIIILVVTERIKFV